ncbi:hypothetical protein ACOMHN_058614 [Nucella lapillus]
MLCQCHTSTQRVTTRTTGQTFVTHAVPVSYINKDHRSDLVPHAVPVSYINTERQQGPQVRPLFPMLCQCHTSTRTTGQAFVPHAVPVSYINKDHRSDLCSPCCASVIHQHRATTRTTGQTFVPHAVPVSYINTEGRGQQQGPQVRPLFPMLCQCHTSTRTTGQAFVPHAVPVSYINKDHRSGLCSPCCASVTHQQGPQVRPLFPMLCQCHTSTQRATTRTTGQTFVPHAVPVSYIHKDHRSDLCSPCCASAIHQQGP